MNVQNLCVGEPLHGRMIVTPEDGGVMYAPLLGEGSKQVTYYRRRAWLYGGQVQVWVVDGEEGRLMDAVKKYQEGRR